MECSNMGESACLRRSFSHPSDASREPKEGDPIRALGESISFGRFMSESLAWEKWSAFSHNRYQEELEKLSKPGSVAQKKAYFEAHYKRKAAQKAAAELEDTNTMVTMNQVETVESAPLTLNNQVIETTEPQNFVQTAEFVSPIDSHEFMNEEIMVETVTDKVEDVLDQNNSMETDPNIENNNQNEKDDDHRKIAVAEDEKTPAAENQAAEKEIMSSGGSLKRLRNYSSKLLTRSWSSKPQASPAKQATTSSLQSIHRDGNGTPKSKKHVGNIVRNLNTKSVHMSMHFKSFPKEIAKTSPELPQIGRKRTHMSSLAASKEASAPPRKFVSRVAASVNGLLKQPLIKPPFENKRCLKSSNAGGTVSKERPPLICSPFSFRSEERVAKRREFFQRLEEKANSKETVQKQPQTRCQERKKNDVTKLRQSINFEAKATQDSNQGSKLPADHINKIPVTRPRSPKLGKKAASSSAVQNISSLPPKRPSVTSNDSKNVMRKRYESTTQSVTCLGKKMNGCENFSPNIQS